jgi:preprotein translocase subunit SecG
VIVAAPDDLADPDVSILLIITILALAMFVLLHKGRGGGMSDLFGGGMSTTMGGTSVAERNLDRLTIVVGLVWLAASFCLLAALPLVPRRRLSSERRPAGPSTPQRPRRNNKVVGGSAIRGSRVGAGPMGEAERGDSAPRLYVSYFCSNGHETRPAFAADASSPRSGTAPAAACRPTSTPRTRRRRRRSRPTRRTSPT